MRPRGDQAPVDPGDERAAGAGAPDPRPAVLDDHGLIPALHSQVQVFSDQTGVLATFNSRGQMSAMTPEQQLVVYRVTQESLSNIAQHAQARTVDVELSFIGRTMLRISDDGRGFTASRDGGLGLSDGASARDWSAASCRSGQAPGPEQGSS